jgi:ketosteroid isomerase-like protein
MGSLLTFFIAAVFAMISQPTYGTDAAEGATGDSELNALLVTYADAATLFYNGQPSAVKELWSHADDVTLSGAAGGPTARGWNEVRDRLEWASLQFLSTKGSKQVEHIQTTVKGDLAYIVQYEHILYFPVGQSGEAKRDYRVTTIFRRERAGWRVVHRHADTLMTRAEIRKGS